MDIRSALAAASAALVLVVLAACVPEPPPDPRPTTEETATPEPTEQSSELDFWLTARNADGSCQISRLGGLDDSGPQGDHPRRVGDVLIKYPDDEGSIPYARGETALDDDGQPIAYVVASGDTPDGISERFCLGKADLALLNMVRRNTAYSTWVNGEPAAAETLFDWIELYAGDTINLDPATITTVGHQNGVVFEHDPGIHLPPQR